MYKYKFLVLPFIVIMISVRSFAADFLYAKAYSHVLKINVEKIFSAYNEGASSTASGFWLGGNSRLIVTNNHVAAPRNVAQYHGVDTSGKRFELELVYANPLIDLAYLRPKDPSVEAPGSVFEYNINAVENMRVFMFGNNGGVGIGQQEGRITNICNVTSTDYWRKSITVNFNGKGGSSGSMVIDGEGKLVGINFSGSDVSNDIIPVEFLLEDLEALEKGQTPAKFDIGLILNHVPLNIAQEYNDFPRSQDSKSYNEKFPGAKSQLLMVTSCLSGSEGEKIFEPGDIIIQVGSTEIGPDLYKYYHALNLLNPQDKARIIFVRAGEIKEVEVPLSNLNNSQCHEMIVFGKAILAPVDQIQSRRSGLKVGSVGLFHNPSGSVFPEILNFSVNSSGETALIRICKLGAQEINTLDDVEAVIPKLIEKKKFCFTFCHHGLRLINGGKFSGTQQAQIYYMEYNDQFHQRPVRLKFNSETKEWERKEIAGSK